jgi:hypothetical protein
MYSEHLRTCRAWLATDSGVVSSRDALVPTPRGTAQYAQQAQHGRPRRCTTPLQTIVDTTWKPLGTYHWMHLDETPSWKKPVGHKRLHCTWPGGLTKPLSQGVQLVEFTAPECVPNSALQQHKAQQHTMSTYTMINPTRTAPDNLNLPAAHNWHDRNLPSLYV